MSNFTVNGVYSYTSSNIYSYLGKTPASSTQLERAFKEYHITPTGKTDDLKKLNNAMYADYSKQVQEQIANQNDQKVVPWAGLCAQIGVQATGDYEKDYAAFNQAIQLLSQSALDGQSMAYFAGLKTEARSIFNQYNPNNQNNEPDMTYGQFKVKMLGY